MASRALYIAPVMSIQSHAFGRVTLTGEDAKQFKRQVRYGKPKKAAVAAVKRGVALSHQFAKQGKITFVVKGANRKVTFLAKRAKGAGASK